MGQPDRKSIKNVVIFRVSIHGINELAGVACASPN